MQIQGVCSVGLTRGCSQAGCWQSRACRLLTFLANTLCVDLPSKPQPRPKCAPTNADCVIGAESSLCLQIRYWYKRPEAPVQLCKFHHTCIIAKYALPYYLSHSAMVLYPVPSTFDTPGNGLILKYGLINTI